MSKYPDQQYEMQRNYDNSGYPQQRQHNRDKDKEKDRDRDRDRNNPNRDYHKQYQNQQQIANYKYYQRNFQNDYDYQDMNDNNGNNKNSNSGNKHHSRSRDNKQRQRDKDRDRQRDRDKERHHHYNYKEKDRNRDQQSYQKSYNNSRHYHHNNRGHQRISKEKQRELQRERYYQRQRQNLDHPHIYYNSSNDKINRHTSYENYQRFDISPNKSDRNQRRMHHNNPHSFLQSSYGSSNNLFTEQNYTYPQKQIEEIQQKVRLAIRNNQIQFDPNVNQIFSNMPLQKQEQLTNQAQSQEKINQYILVRELFISGLIDLNDKVIGEIMSRFGDIQNIQFMKNFAFVKFYKVEDACNACSEYHSINMTLHSTHNPNFKIFFADHTKRWNVVSNHPQFQIKEFLVPVLYVSIKNDPQYNDQNYIRNLFSKYGFIRRLQIQKTQGPTTKVYVLIQYQTLQQAIRARDHMRTHRQQLGDKRCDVTILLNSDKVTRVYPNISNQLRYQKKGRGNLNSLNDNLVNPFGAPVMAPTVQLNSMSMGNNYPSMSMPSMSIAMNMGNTINSINSANNNTMHTLNNMPSFNSLNNSNPNSLIDKKIVDKGAEDIFQMLRQLADKQEPQKQNIQSDWVGFMARNKGFKVEIDMKQIHKVPFELEGIMNVSHRGDFSQGLTRPGLHFAAKFRASNNFNSQLFKGYIRYFQNKKRAGVIQTRQYLIYLFPKAEDLNLPYGIQENELLALFYKCSAGEIQLP